MTDGHGMIDAEQGTGANTNRAILTVTTPGVYTEPTVTVTTAGTTSSPVTATVDTLREGEAPAGTLTTFAVTVDGTTLTSGTFADNADGTAMATALTTAVNATQTQTAVTTANISRVTSVASLQQNTVVTITPGQNADGTTPTAAVNRTVIQTGGTSDTGQTAAQVEAQITGRLNGGDSTPTNDDDAYTTTQADLLLGRKADTSSTVIDTDVGLNASNEVVSINVGGTVRNIASSSDHLEIFSGSTQVSDADTTGLSFTVGSGSASGLTVADTGANVNVRIGIPTSGTVPSNWNTIGTGVEHVLDLETVFAFTDADLGHELVGYVNVDLFDEITITATTGITHDSTWTITGHTLTSGEYYVISWDSSFAVLLADSTTTLLLQRYHVHSGDTAPATPTQTGSITILENVTRQDQPAVNSAAIGAEAIERENEDNALLDLINAEAATRAEEDAIEVVAREAGDAAERDYVDTTLHVDAADSQSYYQFSGEPAIFAEDPAVDYGITIAMPQTIEDTEELAQAENIGTTTKVFKLRLRFNDGANDTKEYVVTTGGYNFTISDERTSETFRLPTIEGTYVAASVHQNGTNTQRQNCFLAIGGWYGRIAQVDMAHVLDVSNGNILTGRTLEVGQDYSEHTIADNNNTAVVGLVFDNQTTGSHTGINAYVLQRRNRIVRYRAATSGGLFSFRNGNSVVDRFHPSRVPDVVSQQTVDESNWLGLKLVTIQNAISNTSASGQSNRLTFAVGDKMLVAVGDAVDSASAGISIPGIAVSKNPSTFTGGSVNLGLFYPGGNDPSEEYSDYSSATEANYDATIFDMEYSNASGAWTFFFGGESNQGTAIATRAAGFHGTSIWNMASISAATKAGAGGTIRSVALGGNIAGLASSTHFWITTELGALWVNTTPWLAAGYGSDALVQAHTNPNDPTSDVKRDFTFRGFQYFDQHGSIGAGDDGHIYRLIINPEVTFTVTFGNVTHTATYRFNDDTAAMHTFFGNPASYSPTLVGSGVSLITTAPGGEPADQLYLDYSVNGQNTPVVSYQWVGVLSTTDDDFETYSPFRRIDLANTVVDIHYPDGGATYHIPLSSNVNDYTVGGEANGAIDQIVTAVNTHTAQGHSAVRVDAGFADTITNTRPVLRLDQTGTHALQNAPVITIAHPSGSNTGTLASESFADGGYDTIGRPGGLFNPNNYDTRAETDAKIAAIASTHGYAENIVANAGNSSTTYTDMDRLQIGTEIYNVRQGLQGALTTDQLAVVNADPFTSANYTPTATSVIDGDIGLNASNEVTSINVGGTVRNLATGSTAQFPSITQWLNSLTAPTGATIVVDDQQITYTPSGGSPVVITFLQFFRPVTPAIDEDVNAILVASGYAVSNEFYINGEDRFYYVANEGNHLHLTDALTRLGTVEAVNTFVEISNTYNSLLYNGSSQELVINGTGITEITANTNYRAVITLWDQPNENILYEGTLAFDSTSGAIDSGGALDIETDETTNTPAFGLTGFVFPGTDSTISIQEEQLVDTYTAVEGDIIIAGNGVVRDGQTFTFTDTDTMFTDAYVDSISQNATTGIISVAGENNFTATTVNGVWDNFRYATLLTTGFLLTEGTTTGTVDEYTDTNGIIGVAATSYFFQNSNDTWYDTLVNAQAAGATGRLIAFPA